MNPGEPQRSNVTGLGSGVCPRLTEDLRLLDSSFCSEEPERRHDEEGRMEGWRDGWMDDGWMDGGREEGRREGGREGGEGSLETNGMQGRKEGGIGGRRDNGAAGQGKGEGGCRRWRVEEWRDETMKGAGMRRWREVKGFGGGGRCLAARLGLLL